MGKLGDRHGRRRIMALSLLGVAAAYSEIFIVCKYSIIYSSFDSPRLGTALTVDLRLIFTGAFPNVFPLQLIWLSSFILMCGGGLNSASAFMWAMASESIPEERRQVH